MVHPDGSQRVMVGVRLERQPKDLGEWLADGAAFDAAGADALWLDLAPGPELDPLVLTAALAGLTYRSLLVVALPGGGPSQAPAGTLATIERLSRGRLRILADGEAEADSDVDGGAVATPDADGAAGFAGLGPVLGSLRPTPADPHAAEATPEPAGARSWVAAAVPDSRAAWRATLVAAAQRGVEGLVVAADPRLLDLLRNPDDLGGRSDLQIAVG